MAYKNRYGSTGLKNKKIDNLSIGWGNFISDYKDIQTDKKHRIPVFLFTPDMDDLDTHYHISLTKKQAKILKNWLENYLKDVGE